MHIGYGCSPGLFPDIYWACARTCPFLHLPGSSLLIGRVDGGYWEGGEKQADKPIVWPDNVLMIRPERIASLRLPFQSPPATRENSLLQSNQVN